MLTIALLQMAADGNNQETNTSKADIFCRQAGAMGADIALFPEMWNVGYTSTLAREPAPIDLWRGAEQWDGRHTCPFDPLDTVALSAVWQGLAIGPDDPYFTHFRELARELNMAIALTYLQRWETLPRNAVSLIDRHGEIVLTYAKVHTCDFDSHEASLTPGDEFHVCSLDTVHGPVRIGTMICYDREFPESVRILMLKGAEIVLVPNACEMEINRLSGLRTRACENMVAVALANYAGPRMGHSVAFDGIAFDRQGSRDMLVVEAGEGEGVYPAHLDLEALRDYRRREGWGNAFRRPHRYGLLTAAEVAEPFVRLSAQGHAFHLTRGRE
jgi:predicted amidohydrolase